MFSTWLIVGFSGYWLLSRSKQTMLSKLFCAAWMMPTTLICGSATLIPWPYSMFDALSGSGCSTWLTAGVSLVLNIGVVFGTMKLYSAWKR